MRHKKRKGVLVYTTRILFLFVTKKSNNLIINNLLWLLLI